jgi:hypothetical protein
MGTAAGCRFVSTQLARIEKAPWKYQGRDVTVAGKVEAVRWLPDTGAIGFRLVDGADSLLVLTLADPPAAGKHLRIAGQVARGFSINGEPRVVLLYRIGAGSGEAQGGADPR